MAAVVAAVRVELGTMPTVCCMAVRAVVVAMVATVVGAAAVAVAAMVVLVDPSGPFAVESLATAAMGAPVAMVVSAVAVAKADLPEVQEREATTQPEVYLACKVPLAQRECMEATERLTMAVAVQGWEEPFLSITEVS